MWQAGHVLAVSTGPPAGEVSLGVESNLVAAGMTAQMSLAS